MNEMSGYGAKSDADDDVSDLDQEIVSDTFRSLVDQDAFDKLIVSWDRRLKALEVAPAGNKLQFPRGMLKQLDLAKEMLERLDIRAHGDPLERIVSEVAGPAMVLSPDLRVAAINVAGKHCFGTTSGAFFSRDCVDPASQAAFTELVRSAYRRGNTAQLVLHIQDQRPGARAIHAEAFLVQTPNQPKPYIAVRTLELAWSDGASAKLIEAFGLTEAEVEVGRHFFETCELAKVAQERGVSLHTVRTQMKTILAKTGAASQADLIRLFAMVASRQMLETRGLMSTWQDPLGREQIINTACGRKIAWTWMGAPNGTPVVYLRGMAMGYLLPDRAERLLVKAGIKLLVPSRPGYGNSSMHEDLPVLEDNRVALHAFLSHIGLKGCVGIGLSDGIIPLLAEQDKHPDTFGAVVSVGFNGCLNRVGCRKLPIPQATLLKLATTAPKLLDLIAQLGRRMMQQHGVDWYLERAHASTPLDLETTRDPETATLVRDACSHLAVQGTRTFVRDMQMFHAPVDAAIDRLRIPMLSMVPTEDGIFDLAEYQLLEQRNENITVVPVEQTADLLIYQQTDFILNRIIDVVKRHRHQVQHR